MSGGKFSAAQSQFRLVSSVLLLALSAAMCPAVEDADTAPGTSEKTLKYHGLLVNRPEPGYLFDRFYNTWLDESTVDSLEAFLLKRVQSSNQTGDRLLLAFFYAKKGDDVSALDQFRQALEHNPASAATWYHKALVEARTLDFDLAIADLKKAREQKPDEKLAIQIDKQLGKILARNRQTAEALKVWQALLAANPADEELTEDLIELHIDEGLFKEAAQLEQQLVDRTKDEYLAVTRRMRLGDIHHRSGDRAKAIDIYTATLEAAGSDSWLEREILAQIDQLYRREDDLTGLKKLYSELLQKYAKRIAIHRRHAQLLVETGEQEPAIAAYREILKLTPGERATREEYIGVLSKIGKQDEAIKELQALCEQHPKDAELRFRQASLHQDAKQADQAVAAINKYLEVSDGSEYAYLRGARLLERLEKKDAAASVYEKMVAKFADSSAAQEAYAAFLYSSGQKEDAIKRWRDLAKGSDVKQTLQVARTLSSRAENEAALDLLRGRIDDIKNEPLFLGQLVTTAMALKKYDDAIPWAIQRVQLADAVADLDTAVDQAATTIERADKTDEEIKKLEAMPKRGVPESCLLAELLKRAGESEKADAVLKKAADEGSLLAVSEQVRLFSQRREWNQAADATRKILELPGGLKSLHVRRLVELYQRDYQLEEGLKWIDEWKRLSPGSTMPWVTEARMLQTLGKTEEALKVLRTAVLKFDEDEDLRVRLAEFYAETEKAADAMRIYWQLYEDTEDLNGKLRWAQKLASIAEGQGTVQQLVQDFEERVRSNRQSIVPLLALSEVYRETDDYEGRRRALTAAAKIKPDDMYLLQQVARVEEQDGDWQAAIATLERAAAMDKTNRTREQIARLYLSYGDADKGYSILFDLAGAADADPRTLETTADSLCATQEWERAANFLERRLPDHPADYRLRYLLGVSLEEAGRPEQAAQQFTQLLSDQEELPAKKSVKSPATQAAQMNSYFDMLRQLLPAEAFEWFELTQSRYTAYAHRQQGYGPRVVLSGASGGTTRSAIQMPQTVENVRPLALSHLLAIAATLDDDKQELVCKDLESHGLKHAEQLMHADPNQGDFRTVLPEVLEKEPENETALAILVMQQMGSRDNSLGDHCATALKLFRKSRPELAFMAAVQAGVNEARNAEVEDDSEKKPENANKYLDEALAIAATFEHPNPMLVMSLTTALGGRNLGNSEDLPVSEAYRQKLSQLLVKWYPEMSKSPQLGSWAFYSAMQSLAQNSDPTAYVHFLDDEVNRFQTGGKGQGGRNQIAQMMYGRQQQQLLTPLAFPPPQLADFPPHVLSAFSKNQNANPFGFASAEAPDPEEYAKKIRPLLDSIKSPELRILFANRAELNDVVEDSLKKMLATKTPQLDAYLLAASWAADHEKNADTVQFLQKSRYLPMKLETRKAVDGAIVAAVLADKQASKEQNKDVLEAGQQASLRLRRSRLEPQQRTELISAMEDLGLKKEAEKLDALAAASGTRTTTVQSYVSAQPVQRMPADRISKLIEQGKRDAAIKQLAAEVSGNVRQIISNPQNQRSQRQTFRDAKQRIEAHSLVDDVLKSLEPGDSKNVQKINEYAVACQLFDRTKDARTAFENALAIRPKDDAARMQLILILANEDPAEGGKQLSLLSKTTRGSFGQLLAEQMQDYEVPFDVRLGYARLAVQYLRTLEASDGQQSYWVENMMNYLGRYMHGRRGSLPSLYTTKASASQDREAENQKDVMAERRKIHQEMCEQMLKMPDLARTGFRHSLASAEAQEKSVDDFADLAEKILLAEAEAKPRTGNRQQQTVSYNSGQNEVRFRSPEEFLARRAWKSGDWKLIDETLLPKLAGAKNRESREQLEQMATLYRCDEAKFIEQAEAVARQSRQALQPGQANDGLAIAVDVWADRGLEVDLQPLVLKQLKQDVGGQNHYQPPAYVIRFVEGIAKKWTRARQLAFLDEVATIYIAPSGKRNDFIKKNYNRNNINWGTPNGRIYVYGQLMEQLCQRSDLVFTMLEHLDQYDEPKPVNNFEYRVRAAVSSVQGSGPEATMKLLENSPWLEDLEGFRPLVLSKSNSQWESPLVVLLRQDAKKADFRKNLKALLEKQQASQPTFGGQLILASLAEEPDSTALLEFVGGKLAAIQALPEKQQQDLATLLRSLVPAKAKEKKDLSDMAKAANEWMTGSQASESRTMLAKLQKAKRLEELGIQYGQADQFIREHLHEMIRNDTDSAVKGFLRLCELGHEAQRRGEWHIGFSDGTTIEGYLLRSVGYANNPDWKSYNFLVDVLRSKDAPKIETGYNVSQLVNNVTNNAMNRANAAAKTGKQATENRIHAFYDDAGPAVESRDTSLLFPALYPRLSGESDAATCKAVLEWTKNEMNGGKYPRLAADLHALYGLMAAEKERNAAKVKSDARLPMAEYHEHFRKIINDDALPIAWRLHVAEFLCDRQKTILPLELATDIIKIYVQALAEKVPIMNNQNSKLTDIVFEVRDEPSAKDLSADWRAKWAERYLRATPASAQRTSMGGPDAIYRLSDSNALCGALRLYLAAAEEGRAKQLLQKYSGNIGHLPITVATLVRADQPEEAARILRGGWPRLALDWPNYDPETEKHVPALLEKLDRDDERYLARVIFASMTDTKPVGKKQKDQVAAAPNRDGRLSKLADEFAGIEFKDPAMKKLCLVLLGNSEVAGRKVASEVAVAFDAKNVLLAFAGNDSTRLTQETRLATCHLRNRLGEGDCDAYVDLLTRLSANPSDDDYQFGNAVSPFIECAIKALRDKNTKPWTPAQCSAMGKALRSLLNDREYVNINNFDNYNAILLVVHCQAGETDELAKWTKKISQYNRDRMQNSGAKDDIWRFGLRFNGPASAENLDARIRYLQNVLRWAFDRQWLTRTGQPYRMRGQNDRNLLTAVVKSGLLTADELKSHGAEAFEGIGPKDESNYAKAVLANWLQSEKDYEKAAEVWRSMAKVAPDAKKVPRNEANYVLGLSVCLKNLKRFDEALAAIDVLKDKDFDAALKASYEQYRRKIQEAAKSELQKNQAEKEPDAGKTSRVPRKLSEPNSASFATVAESVAV